MMLGSFKVPGGGTMANPSIHVQAMVAEFVRRAYPIQVLEAAYQTALGTEHWLPDTARMVAIAEKILHRLRAEEKRLRQCEATAIRRRQEKEQQERDRCELAAAKAALERERPALAQHFGSASNTVGHLFGYERWREWVQAVIEREPWSVAAAERVTEIADPEEVGSSWEPERRDREWHSLHRPRPSDWD
ncbi:MAG: hypothetical protein ACREDL_12865 [Bradyrhizobium sp.]